MSLTGSVTDSLDLVAGAVLSQPRVSGETVRLGISGDRPVGIPSRKFVFAANWRPPNTSGLSFDLGVNYYGSLVGTLDDAVSTPPYTTVDWDTRYEFKMSGQNASLKFAIMNMFNVRELSVLDSSTYGIFENSDRRIDLRLIVDVS